MRKSRERDNDRKRDILGTRGKLLSFVARLILFRIVLEVPFIQLRYYSYCCSKMIYLEGDVALGAFILRIPSIVCKNKVYLKPHKSNTLLTCPLPQWFFIYASESRYNSPLRSINNAVGGCSHKQSLEVLAHGDVEVKMEVVGGMRSNKVSWEGGWKVCISRMDFVRKTPT